MSTGRGERGSVSVEMAILAPVFVLLIVTAIVFGRTAIAANAMDVAAHDAARAASISRTPTAAADNARDAAAQALAYQGLDCLDEPTVVPDVSGFTGGGLGLRFVSVTISCEVSFADIALPGVPQSRVLTTTFISPIDTYRER